MAPRVRPARRRDALLVAGGIVGGFCVTLAVLLAGRHTPAGHAAAGPTGPVRVTAGTSAGPLSPAVLDRQWLAYSDRSGCADRSGGDGVSAVRLSAAQIAWFFADSYLGPAGPSIGFSQDSGLLHNLIVMQTRSGGRSTFVTITGGHACAGPGRPARPGSAVPVVSPADAGGAPGDRYWNADALLAGSRVLGFYNRYLPGRVPFIPVGTVLASFPVSKLAGDGRGSAYGETVRPRITVVPGYTPPGGGTPVLWGAAVLRHGGTVYVYGWQSPDPSQTARLLYLARVPAARLTDVAAWRFYAGNGRWAAAQDRALPVPVTAGLNLDAAFSVTSAAGRYWLIQQAGGPGSPDIEAYPAASPWGPFDTAAGLLLYRAPGIGLSAADNYQLMYGAAAEPALSDRHTLVISYDVNSLAVTAGCQSIYAYSNAVIQPRFIAVPMSAFRAAGSGGPGSSQVSPGQVTADPAGYPVITARQPGEWYDAWNYPSGCPPVPAARGLTARQVPGSVRVAWPALGIGVTYRVQIRDLASGQPVLIRDVRSPRIVLSHLTAGRRYQVLVVPQNARHQSGPGAAITVAVR